MNELEKRFGWRLEIVNDLLKQSNYKEAFNEYSKLVKLFNKLDGYNDYEKLNFYKKIKLIGNNLFFKLSKEKILNEIKGHKFSKSEFNKKLKGFKKENFNEYICNLIKQENFNEVLKFYENK